MTANAASPARISLRIAVITNILAPYRIPFFAALAQRCAALRVLLLAERHSSRDWRPSAVPFETHALAGFTINVRSSVDPVHINAGAFGALRKFGPDVVLSGGYSFAHLEALAYCITHRRDYVAWGEHVSGHSTERSPLRRMIRRRVLRNASACIASSTATRDTFVAYGADSRRTLISLMPVGTQAIRSLAASARDTGRCRQLREQRSTPIFLCASRLVDEKGIPNLLEAFAAVQAALPQATLILAGDGPAREAYAKRVVELALRNVEFVGQQSQAQLAAWYAAADVFAFPTLHDTFGAVLPEALAAGAIVVSSPHAAATADFVTHGLDGFVADPYNCEEFASAMLAAARLDKGNRTAMLTRAAMRVSQDDYARSATEIVEFLASLPGRQHRAPAPELPSHETTE